MQTLVLELVVLEVAEMAQQEIQPHQLVLEQHSLDLVEAALVDLEHHIPVVLVVLVSSSLLTQLLDA